ncbi:MFS transporter [Dethiobacter alkaliphilus]|uniref:MFS transporter n=1 Tax=Dethiobacter alkaliphilus TaxID=427926 RepID=UPI002225D253|nr:MFS transporter [Dethiobacter alkaliphilus]MCW3489461.1 MFS transporter [Dethiobacter alkaliphilus]
MIKQLPVHGKLLYAASSAGWAMLDRIVITWLMFYYTEGENPLVLPAIFGSILVFGRVVDAIADPLVALWSDNSSSRLGRRKPFLMVGALLYAAVFVALFYPPAAEHSTANVIYLLVMAGAYFFMFTVYVCPYLALMPELARTAHDRVDMATYRAVFSLLGVAAALVGSGLLIGSMGFRGMIWTTAIIGMLLMYLPVLVKEREYADAQPATLGLVDAVLTTLKNRAFRFYLAGNAAFWFGFNIITLGLPFYVTVLLGRPEEDTAILFAAAFGVAFLAFPLVNILAKKIGHKAVMIISMALFVLILPQFYFLGRSPLGLDPVIHAYLVMALAGIPLSSLFVLPDAIVSSITDLEAGLSGQRREAMYFGTQGLVLKIMMGLSTFVTGLMLQFFGRTAVEPLGVQLTGPVAALFVLIGGIIFWFYPEREVREGEQAAFPPDAFNVR